MADIFTYELNIDMKEEFQMGYDTECHQLDTITFKCYMYNEGVPLDTTNYSVKFQAKKPDGSDYIQTKYDIEKGIGYININCRNQLTVASGMCKAELCIWNSSLQQRTSRIINIRIIPSVLEVDRTLSKSTITELEDLHNTLNNLDDSIEKANTFVEEHGDIISLDTRISENENKIKNISVPYDYQGAIITFVDDDGNTEFVTRGLQAVYDARNIKPTLAIVTDNVGKTGHLTVEQLKTLQDNGYEIVSHSKTHSSAIFKTAEIDISTVSDATIESELKTSQDFLKNNGLNGYDVFVYPWGNFVTEQAIRIKRIARKYYNYALNSIGVIPYNSSPVDNMYMNRYFLSLTQDFTTVLKPIIDTAVANKGWLILSHHSYDTANISAEYLTQVVDYIISLGVPILPFSEASKLKGNVFSVGEFTDNSKKFYLGIDGELSNGNTGSINMTPYTSSDPSINDAGTSYKIGVTVKQYNVVSDSILGNVAGEVITFRGDNNDFIFQQFTPYNSNDLYMRHWSRSASAWLVWEKISGNTNIIKGSYTSITGNTMDDIITKYPKYKVTIAQIVNTSDALASGGGTLYTYHGDNYYSYQQYFGGNGLAYYRKWTGADDTGTWGTWKVQGHIISSTTARNALPTTILYIGLMVYDTNLGKPLWLKSISPVTWVDATGTVVS